ncbi:Ferrichrome receptor FcuA [Pandoraea iniqua]|uniref:TonB-dependent siderophore receptor n=1 Tax=Pandoraea iniqua TaxID=2508288 RepID=UPI001240C74A|nr:TonB-dependent siderophore receptor [Pandoraea iniqua]VVE58249.1 Ferrichrome receptor FcuA [Pandoraea iniqua]
MRHDLSQRLTHRKTAPATAFSASRVSPHTSALYARLVAAGLCLAGLLPLAAQAQAKADAAATTVVAAAGSEATLPEVNVSAAQITSPTSLKRSASAGALGNHPEIETPFSIKSVSGEEIEDRQANILSEAVKYDASVTSISTSYSTHPATLAVRGLPLDDLNGYKIDGLASVNRGVEMPLEMFDRIEVLKGLTGFMYGFGSPGGIVNYVTKRATEQFTLSYDQSWSEDGVWKEHLDTGGRFGKDDRFGFRFNAVHEEGNAAADSAKINRTSVGLGLDARLTNDLTVTLDTMWQERRTSGGVDIITSPKYSVPDPISGRSKLYSNGSYTDVTYKMATLGVQYKIAPEWVAKVAYRYSDSVRQYKKDQYYLSSNKGDYSDRISAEYHSYEFDEVQATVEGKFKTGPLTHEIVVGASNLVLLSNKSVNTPKVVVGNGNLYSPTIYSANNVNFSGGTYGDDKLTQRAIFASDRISYGSWSLLAGVRYQTYDEIAHASATAAATTYHASPVTPTVALMYSPRSDLTFYTSYVESLEQGGTADSTTKNANQQMAPIKSHQYEVGVKTDQGRWRATAALFRVERGAEYVNSANYFVQDGKVRYQGVELGGSVDVLRSLTLDASVMGLNSEYVNAAAGVNGKRAVGAPNWQAAFQATWRVPAVQGLYFQFGVRYLGGMAIDSGNVNYINPSALLDAGVGYRTRMYGKLVTLRANVTNLTDRRYWSYYQENYLQVGAPRTLSLNARIDF